MSQTVDIVVPAQPLSKALAQGNSIAPEWSTTNFVMSPVPPQVALGAAGDGIYGPGRTLSATGPLRLYMQPYATGPNPTNFSMRVWGWRPFGSTEGDGPTQVWNAVMIAEFYCTTCNYPGPPGEMPTGGGSLRPIKPNEYMCDTVQLVQGDLGASGWINMTGQPGAPTDLPGYILMELQGCKLWQFDFKQSDPVEMNCLWTRA